MTERLSESWRPRSVREIVGQPEAVSILEPWIANPDRPPMAWCFVGEPSTGKTTAAMCVAECLNDGAYPAPDIRTGLDMKVEELPMLHQAQLVCGDFTCGSKRMHKTHSHILLIDEFERLSPHSQNWIKSNWEPLPPRAVILATSNSLDAISDACVQRFSVIEFDSGPAFEKAALDRCVQIWTTEITKRFGVEAPTFAELRRLGDSRDKFSLRTCLNKIEQKLSILTHNAKPPAQRRQEADEHAERIGL